MIRLSRKKLIISSVLTILVVMSGFFVFGSGSVSAQADNMLWGNQQGNVQNETGLGNADPRILIANIIRVVLGFLGIVAVVLIMYAGWLWMTAAGEADKIDRAKKVLISAVIGLVIILMSFAIATFILNKIYDATHGLGGGGGSCQAGNVGATSGCNTCVDMGGGTYQWVFTPAIPGCSGTIGAINCSATPGFCTQDQPTCDAYYGLGNSLCNTSCVCQTLGNIGDPCDNDLSNQPTCDYDDTMCMADLNCNTTSCLCEGAPVIDWISPVDSLNIPNGAVGNLVTIGGRFFGTTTGQVYFSDGSGGEVLAPFPNTVNPNCTSFWNDNQVIVVVPAGAGLGRIRIWRPDGKEDLTDNTRGPNIPDFKVNTLVRPGLCQLSPPAGLFGDTINYQGINLSGSYINFGSYSTFVVSPSAPFSLPQSGNAQVPNLTSGRTTTYASSSSAYGNSLYFTVNPSSGDSPYITSFEPTTGAKGAYVTIYGGGFGNGRGTNRVLLNNGTDFEADYDFPDVCSDSFWRDNQIVIKVPAVVDDNYIFKIDLGSIIIDTSALIPSDFTVNNSLPLAPGLCKIQPIMGLNNTDVSVWGEYFKPFDANSKVRFHLNHDQSGAAITTWGPDGDAEKAATLVHNEAVSGPVRLVIGAAATSSNGMNFRIGKCAKDVDCGTGNFCCDLGTFAAGRCVANEDDCYADISSSVFEWQFNTGNPNGLGAPCDDDLVAPGCQASSTMCATPYVCDPGTCTCAVSGSNSCAGFGLGSCLSTLFCPNSPGQCSAYAGGNDQDTGACDYSCNSIAGCTGGLCHYDSALDRCVLTAAPTCDNTKTVLDINGGNVTASCKLYSSENRWHFNTLLSCPLGWLKIAGNQCVDMTASGLCSLCPSGFSCNSGSCAASKDICSGASQCRSTNRCTKTDVAACECCCEIGYDARDCCAPLKCEGNCGSDANPAGPDTDTHGYCSGCALAGSTQAEHDAACNCTGHTGKYCDTSVGDGICRDCALLSTASECNTHVTTCCVDDQNSGACRGGNGNLMPADFGKCAYYDCLPPSNTTCDTGNPTPTAAYPDTITCANECANNAPFGLGLSCAASSTGSGPSPACNFTICSNPFGCWQEDGSLGNIASDCGFCCCKPGSSDCSALNPLLVCQPDKSPCSGSGRGLCCGCSKDIDCGDPDSIGCGDDTCCRTRPSVSIGSEEPADEADKICRNSLIYAEFDSLMEVGSFTSNMIVVGDYLDNTCPAGTTYLAFDPSGEKKGFVKRLAIRVKAQIARLLEKVLPSDIAGAYTAPDVGHTYCAVSGQVTGYNTSATITAIQFAPSNLLDGDRQYYAIILGDKNLDSQSGVLNFWGIGMNGAMDYVFNGITYSNAHVWRFRTLSEQSANNGVCALDHVNVKPGSYLFQTNQNDANEKDSPSTAASFDTVKDSDKVFISYPKSADNQTLVSIPSIYAWEWGWSSLNTSVADAVTGVFPANGDRQLIRASDKLTEGKTTESVTAEITADTIFVPSTVTQTKSGYATIYLFVCDNPWPPVKAGLWQPWIDDPFNCTVNLGTSCMNTNYEFYYCRDANNKGTYDDLPPILDRAVIRQMAAGTGGNILKEAFYLREKSASASTSLTLSPDPLGQAIVVTWGQLSVSDPLIVGYKLYWGRASGNYTDSQTVNDLTNDPVTKTINNLTNGVKYYFNLTSYYATGTAESALYGEQSAIPADTTPPPTPVGFTVATTTADKIQLTWIPVADAKSYEILYGTVPGIFGYKENVGSDTEVVIEGLTKSPNPFYFGVVAIDASKNRSATSTKSFIYN